MALIGYARVSTVEGRQLLDRQRDSLDGAGCERIFEDRASGTDPGRPGLAACLDHMRTGIACVSGGDHANLARLHVNASLHVERPQEGARTRPGAR